jgi:hypothetical protein
LVDSEEQKEREEKRDSRKEKDLVQEFEEDASQSSREMKMILT